MINIINIIKYLDIIEFSFQSKTKELLNKVKAPNSFDSFIKFRVIDHFVLFFKKKHNLKIDQNFSKEQFDEIYQYLKLLTNNYLFFSFNQTKKGEEKKLISELKKFIISNIKNDLFEFIKILYETKFEKIEDLDIVEFEKNIVNSPKVPKIFKELNLGIDRKFIKHLYESLSDLNNLQLLNQAAKFDGFEKNTQDDNRKIIFNDGIIFDKILKQNIFINLNSLDEYLDEYINLFLKSMNDCINEINKLKDNSYYLNIANKHNNLERLLSLGLYDDFRIDLAFKFKTKNNDPNGQQESFFKIPNQKIKILSNLFDIYSSFLVLILDSLVDLDFKKLVALTKINRYILERFISFIGGENNFLKFIQDIGAKKLDYLFSGLQDNEKLFFNTLSRSKLQKILNLNFETLINIDLKFFLELSESKKFDELISHPNLKNLYLLWEKDKQFLTELSVEQINQILDLDSEKLELIIKNLNSKIYFFHVQNNFEKFLKFDNEFFEIFNNFKKEDFQELESSSDLAKFSINEIFQLSNDEFRILQENFQIFNKIKNDFRAKIFDNNRTISDISPNIYYNDFSIFERILHYSFPKNKPNYIVSQLYQGFFFETYIEQESEKIKIKIKHNNSERIFESKIELLKFFIELIKEYKEKNPVENNNDFPSSKINLMNIFCVKEIQVDIW